MTQRKFFGTDGIRGLANTGNMTAEKVLKVGMAAGSLFTRGSHRHRVVIGKDTRISGYMLEPALVAGFISVGMDVILVGPMPTPAVAMLTRSLRADLGVMISASHNPYQDNGIKLFGPDGYKLSDGMELLIEERMNDDSTPFLVEPKMLGRAKRLDDAPGRYIEFIKNTFPKGSSLDGLKIVIDCANGAAYHLGTTILWELGAEVIPIGVSPDGFNINAGCGSTYADKLCEAVIGNQADLGIALDGDADRLVMVDEKGNIVDGDQLMALIATSWHEQGLLKQQGIVTTVMSNIGLEHYLKSLDLHMVRAQVGDRYVMEEMRKKGYNVGGEQSGHIILNDYATTGDGLLAALQILAVIAQKKRPASEICRLFSPFPQILKNIAYQKKSPVDHPTVEKAIKAGEEKLGNAGRVLIRKSGTEPLIRIMVEGENEVMVGEIVNDIAEAMQRVIAS